MIVSPDCQSVDEVTPAVNFGERKGDTPIDMIVLHYTGMTSELAARDWLAGAESGVSAHYLIFESGKIIQMVAEAKRAWHAGVSKWRGHEDINSRSIGIEICNPGHEHGYQAFPVPQIEAVIGLCQDVSKRHPIESRNVVAHSDIAPSRKRDPGELFPWGELASSGVGHWVEPSPVQGGRFWQTGDSGEPVLALQELFKLFGYPIEKNGQFDEKMVQVVGAFQRHFRQERVDGVADHSTVETLYNLLAVLSLDNG